MVGGVFAHPFDVTFGHRAHDSLTAGAKGVLGVREAEPKHAKEWYLVVILPLKATYLYTLPRTNVLVMTTCLE